MTVLLEIESVAAGYGSGPDILNGLSLEVEAGVTYCMIGPNGAGKSTVLKLVGGILAPRSGSIRFKGEEVGGLRPDQLLEKGICFVPQDPSLFRKMTVRRNLMMGGYLQSDRSVARNRLEEILEMFPVLAEKEREPAGSLSGGQQQILLMARALMIEPTLMMIDEPSLGLDPRAAEFIFQTIAGLKDLGMTILLVEQSVERGLDASDRAFVLDLGQLRFQGPSDQILADPRIRELYMGKAPTIE